MKSYSIASVALASVPLIQAGLVKRDLVIQTLDNWSSLGCYSDSQSSRTLSVAAHFGEHVSDTNCQYQCQQLGYAYAGTEYSGQCYCDNSINSIATSEPSSDCNMACTGDNTQPCGGSDRINLFWNGTSSTPSSTVAASTVQNVDGWYEVGCYTDAIGARALSNEVNTAGGASEMTVQTCVDACYSAGYSLAGVEYADECYCDNAIQNAQGLASDQTTCNMACKGDATSFCGGAGRMNLYSYGDAPPANASVTSTPTPVAVAVTLPSGWTTLGCYTDAEGQRALSHFFNEPSSGMTVEYCVSTCAANGYSIAGVEYGSECYCDTSVQNGQGQAPDGNVGCDMACDGNAGETCGGPDRLNLYAAGPGWTQLGCYSDQPYNRTLSTLGDFSGDLTVEKCLASCYAAGYPYSGVEYGEECHCGSSFDHGGGPAPDGSAGCSFTCAGNSSEICGGSNRLSMFAYISANGTIAATTPVVTSTSTTAATPTPQKSNLPTGWSYQNCYLDQKYGRILGNEQPDSSDLTATSCITACSAAGYTIAGLEYSDQCFCDNAIQNGGTVASAWLCSMPCSGDSTHTCGGSGVMNIYATGTLTVDVPPSTQSSDLPASWSYTGCYADSIDDRIFSVEQDLPDTADASSCISYCAESDYSVAGIEYGDQCYCGTSDQLSVATTSTQCTMVCAGNSTAICGGPGAMSVYSLS